MKRASLNALPAASAAQPADDLTDRLLQRDPARLVVPLAPPEPRRPARRPAAPKAAPEDSLAPALLAAEQAVSALQRAARTEPARYEVALRYRLDALAHHVQQVKDYLAAVSSR